MIVYLDVLLLINLLMNIVILYFVALILNLKQNLIRLVWGSIVGSLLLIEVLYPKVAFLQSLEFKFIISVTMVIVSFKPHSLRDFVKMLGFFYLISFMVGGGVLAFFYLLNMDKAFINGISLFNSISVPWWILLVSASLMLLFFKYIWPLLYMILSKDKLLVSVTVILDNKSVSFPALIDTGNDLSDPISNSPVIIAEFDVIKDLFNQDFQEIMKSGAEGDFHEIDELIPNYEESLRFRLIPYESIGKIHGMMVGFKPDLVIICFENKALKTQNVIIGIYKRHLSTDITYRALLNPGLLNG